MPAFTERDELEGRITVSSPLDAVRDGPVTLDVEDYSLLSPFLGGFARYWEARRRGRDIPDRADLDVLDLKPWLGWINVLDVIDQGEDFRYRVFGTRHVARLGADLTGKRASETKLAVRANFTRFLGRIIAARRPVLTVVNQKNLDSDHVYEWRRLGVPLTRGGTAVDTIMVLAEAGDLTLVAAGPVLSA